MRIARLHEEPTLNQKISVRDLSAGQGTRRELAFGLVRMSRLASDCSLSRASLCTQARATELRVLWIAKHGAGLKFERLPS